jgi:hypothetical protein
MKRKASFFPATGGTWFPCERNVNFASGPGQGVEMDENGFRDWTITNCNACFVGLLE